MGRKRGRVIQEFVCFESKQFATGASQKLQIPLTVKVVLQNVRYVVTDMKCKANYERTVAVDSMQLWWSTEVFLMT
nr:unnamed protein product [Callosobruchus analis]